MRHPKHPNPSESDNSDWVKASETSGVSITPEVRITPGYGTVGPSKYPLLVLGMHILTRLTCPI